MISSPEIHCISWRRWSSTPPTATGPSARARSAWSVEFSQKKNKSLRQRAEEVVLQISVDYGSIFFARFGWKAAPSAGLAKVDFAKSCFQRT
jgi:hypothetical protein